jgi:PAS domain S-box-containing protein
MMESEIRKNREHEKPEQRDSRAKNIFIITAGFFSAVIGLLVLLGWILRLSSLTSFGTNLIPMAPSTALLFILNGCALAVHTRMPQSRGVRVACLFIGAFIAISGLSLFFSSSRGIYLGIERLGFPIVDSPYGIPIGHMSPLTAIFFLAGAVDFLLMISLPVERSGRAVSAFVLSFLLFIASSLFLIAYMFASPMMYGGVLVPPALPTMLAFLFLSLGLLMNAGFQLWSYERINKTTTLRLSYVLFLIFMLFASGILAGGYFAFQNYQRNYRTGVEQQLAAVVDLKVDQIERWRKERMGDGQIFYRNEVFSAAVKRYVQHRNDRSAKQEILTWAGQVQNAGSYDLMMLLDAQLNTLLVFPENKERARLVIDQNNTEILRSGNIAFQDFYLNDQDRHIYLKILVPIMEDRSAKRLIAVLALRISPEEYLFPLIKKWPVPSRTSETLIVRRDGNDALFLNDPRFLTDAALKLRIPLERKDVIAVKAVLGGEGIVEGIDYRGVPVIADVRAVPNSGWFLVARMDREEMYEPLRGRMWLIVILVVALLAGGGVALVWRYQRSLFYRTQHKMADELRYSEIKYRRLFEAGRDGILLLDADTGTIVDVNPFLIEVLGFPYEHFHGKKIWELESFKDITVNHDKFLELQKGYFRYKNLKLETHDGRKIDVEFISNVYQVDNYKIIQCNMRDLTERKWAEESLYLEYSRHKRFIDSNIVGVIIATADGKIIEANDYYLTMLGFTRKEFTSGKVDWRANTPTDWLPADEKAIKELREGGICAPYEKEYRKKDGTRVPVLIAHTLLPGPREEIAAFVIDITERKRAEESIRKSEAQLRAILDATPFPIALVDVLDNNIEYWSRSAFTLFGHTAPTTDEWYLKAYPDPDYRREVIDRWKQSVERARLSAQAVNTGAYRVVCRNGSVRICELYAVFVADRLIVTFNDVTERQQAEENLIYERNLLNALMDNMPDHIFFKDNESRFIRISKAQANRFGLSEPALAVGKTDFDFFTEEYARPAFENEQEIVKTGNPSVGLEEKETRPDGRRTWASTTKVPLYDDKGKIIGTFGISRDITKHKLMEEELRKNEERFRKIFEESQLGMILSDPDFRYEKVNPAFCAITGYSVEELTSKSFVDITHPDDIGKDIENMRKLAIGEIPFYKTEKRYRHKIGGIVWGNIVISSVRHKDGSLLYYLGMIENITERKQKEEEIRRLNRVYAVLSKINELIVREGDRQTLLNEVCKIAVREGEFQMSWIGIIDLKTNLFKPAASAGKENGYLEYLHTSIVQIMAKRAPFYRTLLDGQIVICNDIEHDDRLTSQGKKTLALGYRSLAAFPLHIDDVIIGVVNFYSSEKDFFNEEELKLLEELSMDVSYALYSLKIEDQRTQAATEMQESEKKYRRIFENVQDVYYEALIDGTILEISPSIETISKNKYNRNELIGKSLNDFCFNIGEDQTFLSAIQERGSVTDFEITIKNQDGSQIPCALSAKLQFNAQGNPEKIIGSISDITDRKLYQNQLMQTQKVQSIGTLAGGIAHDFNNILGIILAFNSILERSKANEENIRKSTTAIAQAVSRGATLVRQILTFARQTGVSMKPMRVSDLIRELVAMLKETFPEVIEFQTSIGKNIPIINADQTQLHQVLLNLCVNARDAMPKGGTIGIEVKTIASETLIQQFPKAEKGRYISVRVSDTGVGMDEAAKSRIFDPFFTTKEKGKGTGLGLSVVYGVIQEHHGFISVDSKVGKGTTFYLYLPVPQEEKKIGEGEKVKTEAMQSGSETILFAEDEQLLREIVQSTLESMGYKVIVAGNGKEAVDIYKKHFKSIALVLTDVGLPKLLGTDVFAMMKEINPDVKVVFASGFMSLETKSELVREGAKGFILKPYNLNEVLQIVREVLDENKNLKP